MHAASVLGLLLVLFTRQADGDGNTVIQLYDIYITTPNSIASYVPNCGAQGVTVSTQAQIVSQTSASQSVQLNTTQTGAYSIYASNATFTVVNPANFYVITLGLTINCYNGPVSQSANESFLLWAVEKNTWDPNPYVPGVVQNTSANYNMTVQASLSRNCLNANSYGFNCDQWCSNIDNGTYCISGCWLNGTRTCCNKENVQNGYCNYDGVQITTSTVAATSTWPGCDNATVIVVENSSKQNLYFWLMIGFVIFCAFLLLLLLIMFIFLCCFKADQRKVQPAPAQIQPYYVERQMYPDNRQDYLPAPVQENRQVQRQMSNYDRERPAERQESERRNGRSDRRDDRDDDRERRRSSDRRRRRDSSRRRRSPPPRERRRRSSSPLPRDSFSDVGYL